VLGVVGARHLVRPTGIAYPVGLAEHRNRPATTYWVDVNKVELPGRWLCVGRTFVGLGEAADEL
jgi:hypothetical protein